VNPSYNDIKKLAGEPLWYSEGGVPRYAEFQPNLCGIYNRYVAFLRIACQACKREFSVASCIVLLDEHQLNIVMPMRQERPEQDAWDLIGSFHYGDSPWHDCVGDTMNSVPLRIEQFWKREIPHDWTRDISLEFSFPEYTEGSLQL
jgi:hypothetical protein